MYVESIISLEGVSKCFKRYERPVDRLREFLIPGHTTSQEFWALRDINLEVKKGETMGIVGRNGSGKSTLLQIIAGTLQQTSGQVGVKGRISALLELGSGFNPEFTGRQNVFFNGRLLGLTHAEIEDRFDEIARFADIGDFLEQPVKTYSSGMFVRLAFAVAVNVDPEILIVDEALAVGDIVFQHRCMRKMRSLMDSGVTTLFVSHDPGAIKTLCNSAVLIHEGQIQAIGLPNAIINDYLKLVTDLELESNLTKNTQSSHETGNKEILAKQSSSGKNEFNSNLEVVEIQSKNDDSLPIMQRRGSGKATIEHISIRNQAGVCVGQSPVLEFDDEVTLLVRLKANFEFKNGCILGFFLCDKNGNEILGSNTEEEGVKIERLSKGEKVCITFKFKLSLRPGSYSLTVAGAEDYEGVTFDWIDNALVLQVLPPRSGKRIHALVYQPMEVNIETDGAANEVLKLIST